jgi:hypothetical protein
MLAKFHPGLGVHVRPWPEGLKILARIQVPCSVTDMYAEPSIVRIPPGFPLIVEGISPLWPPYTLNPCRLSPDPWTRPTPSETRPASMVTF